MELRYPWVVYIGAVAFLLILILGRKKKVTYKEGKKVANIDYIEETKLYKKLNKQYKMYSTVAYVSLLVAVALSFLLLSRPAKVEIVNTELRNRDIFLCMDISSSVDELNLKICTELKELVRKLDGERFGITIFNAKSVLLVPLTNDYEYVMDTLDKLEDSFEESIKVSDEDFDFWLDDADYDLYNYKYQGTLSEKGSSMIGDGLASCLYSFPDLTKNNERSRLIIFTTDNELNGVPLVTLEEAAKLCKKNEVKVFAIAPENAVDEDVFKSSIESTGGEYYVSTSKNVFDDLKKDIEKTKTSKMNKVETLIYDQPQIIFVAMMVFLGVYFVLSRKIKR